MIGIVIGCSSVTKMGDYYGRRPVYLMGLILNFVLVGMLIVLRNVIVVYFCLFMLGISIAARYYVGYTFNLEFQPKRSQVIVSVVQFSAESIVYLLNIAYFVYISDRWIPLQIPNLILTLVGVIFVYFMPETPRFLVATKKYDSAREVFAKIAKYNGACDVQTSTFTFDVEVESEVSGDAEKKKVSWRDIWADPILRTNLWAAILIYSEASFNFYLLTFYLKYFPGNIFENSTFFACSDLIAFVLCGIFL